MKRQQPVVITVITALLFICLPLLCASAVVGAMMYGVENGLGLHTTPLWIGRVVLAPLLYVVWLLLLLSFGALEIQGWRRFLGFHKPSRISESDRFHFYLILMSYMRRTIVNHFPLVPTFMSVDGLRHLVLWNNAPRVTLGERSFLFGWLYDADLTDIAEGVILGAESFVVAHSITTNPDGLRLYVSAPVTIGARSVIGGQSRVDLGVRIGADAIVEPMSYVAPFTVIGDGEVWGGNPAKFLRARFEATDPPSASPRSLSDRETPSAPASNSDSNERAIREIVATALDLPLEQVTGDLAVSDCASWDSLAQMGIAVALQQQFGVSVPATESFRLRSIADIRALVDGAGQPGVTASRGSTAPVLPANPELLPLMDYELVTTHLASASEPDAPTTGHQLPVVVAATFTAEPLASPVKLWSRAFGVSAAIEFAGFNQVPQTLLSPVSAFGRNHGGVNLVLVRPEDLLSGPEQLREQAVGEVLNAIEQFAARLPGMLIVGTLPPAVSPFFSLDRASVERYRALWQSRLEQIAGIELLDFAAVVERLGLEASRNSDMEVVTRAPYSAAVYRNLGIEVARHLRRRVKPAAKVLALDADQVLWGGILGEDGIDGVHLGPDHPGRAFQLFQQHVLALKQRGVLLVLVSRNNPDDVWQMLERHPEMKLRRGDFAAVRVNWQPKSQNLRELAAELNLGLDSFVFVDDDPAIRLEVETNAPGVVVVPLPVDASEYCQALSRLWCFDTVAVTTEDLERTAMIQQEQLRQSDRTAAGGMDAYLASLGLVVTMQRAEAGDLPRVAQLTQKTNQFNLSLKRRSLPEIQALARDARVHVVRAHDRFGDYGLVGVCILVPGEGGPDQLQFDTLLLSCRALGRGVEDALLYGVRIAAESAGATTLIAPLVEVARNQPVREFLDRSGFRESTPGVYEHVALDDVTLPPHVTLNGLHAGGE